MPKNNHIETIKIMKKVKKSNCKIAEMLGLTEGTIRYRVKRDALNLPDKRTLKPSGFDKFAKYIEFWIESYTSERKKPRLKVLYNNLVVYHNCDLSYDAFVRYMRKHYPQFHKKGSRDRIETPPGELMQIDWKEDLNIQISEPGNWVKVHGLAFTLCFSRKTKVRFSFKKDLASFLTNHQEVFRAFGGFTGYIRTDCLKSAIRKWRGQKSELNESYDRYLTPLGIKVFPAQPGKADDKGKIEKKILDTFSMLDLKHHVFEDLMDFQDHFDKALEKLEQNRMCGATGLSVQESFEYEKKHLKPLPDIFPMIPVSETHTNVRDEGTVYFENNYYQVPGLIRGQRVLCVNTGQEIVIYHDGEEIERCAYLPQARGMVRLSEKALLDKELKISDTVRRWALTVARRQVDIYNEIIGARR